MSEKHVDQLTQLAISLRHDGFTDDVEAIDAVCNELAAVRDKLKIAEDEIARLLRHKEDLRLRNHLLRDRVDLPDVLYAKRMKWYDKAMLADDLSAKLKIAEEALGEGQWVRCEERLPERKEGWNHTDEVLVWYEGGEHKMVKYGIAYYHYDPPHRAPEWVDFANLGRVPWMWKAIVRPEKGGDVDARTG